ncbi:13480_t:CDS:2 [Dentiscutata erythropus]|uniref:13480_t:CDS:1 n=1 Tax=Dentiscutata erythropus TaxID=1348616 RepID=A0A9N9A7J1_9GLOM|nr:13480_t:CDS:2 [Dentiscutata erythropus]
MSTRRDFIPSQRDQLPNAKKLPGKNYNKISSKCPYTEAKAIFDNIVHGFVVFTQDKYGNTQVNGIFRDGLINPPYQFYITDKCGNVIRNITQDLNVKYINNGTKPFSAKLISLNLNCNKNGILFANCGDPYHNLKRQDDGFQMSFYENGFIYYQANIGLI